jgi:hypothetical protein
MANDSRNLRDCVESVRLYADRLLESLDALEKTGGLRLATAAMRLSARDRTNGLLKEVHRRIDGLFGQGDGLTRARTHRRRGKPFPSPAEDCPAFSWPPRRKR